MKRFIFTALFILGSFVFANAQGNDLADKADKVALELTKAVNSLMQEEISIEEYEKKCNEAGIQMGLHVADMTAGEIQTYLNCFYNSIYYYFAKYDIDKETADYLVDSFKESWAKSAVPADEQKPASTSVTEKADSYARTLAGFIEATLDGKAEDENVIENTGVEMGLYLSELSESEVMTFKDQFYKSIEAYLLKIEAIDADTCRLLMDTFKTQFDEVFKIFL